MLETAVANRRPPFTHRPAQLEHVLAGVKGPVAALPRSHGSALDPHCARTPRLRAGNGQTGASGGGSGAPGGARAGEAGTGDLAEELVPS